MRCLTSKTTKNSYKMPSVMKSGPNVSIELLKLISTQNAHKTCHKQGSKLHYLGTNKEVITTSENYKITLCISKIRVKRKSFSTSAYTLSRQKTQKNHKKGKGKEKKRE